MAGPIYRVGIQRAADLVGVSRWTVHRRINEGKLSTTRDNQGRRRVDLAELARVFEIDDAELARLLEEQRSAPGSARRSVHQEQRSAPSSAGAEVADAPSAVRVLEATVARLSADLERERERAARYEQTAAAWQERYAKLAERALLTDQRPLHNSGDNSGEAPTPTKARRRKREPKPRSATEEIAGIVSSWLTGGR